MSESLEMKRIPLNGTFELTVRCNLKCKMCLFRHDDSENEEIIKNERTTEEWIDMARQVAEAGTIKLLITGGEPMLRPDFCEIYEEIYKLGFVITLYTNATLITPKIVETLKKYPPHKIGVTLYGASAETYEKVCGNPKAYERAVTGIEKLSELPSIMEIRTTIIKDNYKDVDNMKKWVFDKFSGKVPFIISRSVFKPVRGGTAEVEACRLSPEENIDLIRTRTLVVMKESCNKVEKVLFKVLKDKSSKKEETIYGCKAGINSYAISWDGKMLGCQMLSWFETNPFENGFIRAWKELPEKYQRYKSNSKCNNCKNSILCSSCIAVRIAETGNENECPTYLCREVEEMKKYLLL